MANRIVSVHAGIYGMGIYAIMLPSSGFLVAHCGKSCESSPNLNLGLFMYMLLMIPSDKIRFHPIAFDSLRFLLMPARNRNDS